MAQEIPSIETLISVGAWSSASVYLTVKMNIVMMLPEVGDTDGIVSVGGVLVTSNPGIVFVLIVVRPSEHEAE